VTHSVLSRSPVAAVAVKVVEVARLIVVSGTAVVVSVSEVELMAVVAASELGLSQHLETFLKRLKLSVVNELER